MGGEDVHIHASHTAAMNSYNKYYYYKHHSDY